MSRRVYLLGVGLALLALAFAVTEWGLGTRAGGMEAKVRLIRPGMGLAEVQALLGGPGRFRGQEGNSESWTDLYEWTAPDGEVFVLFESRGDAPVAALQAHFTRSERPGLIARLRAWLGW